MKNYLKNTFKKFLISLEVFAVIFFLIALGFGIAVAVRYSFWKIFSFVMEGVAFVPEQEVILLIIVGVAFFISGGMLVWFFSYLRWLFDPKVKYQDWV